MDNNFRISSNKKLNDFSKNLPSEITRAKRLYSEFVSTMDKSDFCNTSGRYIAEMVYVRELKKLYFNYNYATELQEMSDREDFIYRKLKNEFGITYNE